MTIYTLGDKYYIPVENGIQEISKLLAWDMFESGEVTHWEEIQYD